MVAQISPNTDIDQNSRKAKFDDLFKNDWSSTREVLEREKQQREKAEAERKRLEEENSRVLSAEEAKKELARLQTTRDSLSKTVETLNEDVKREKSAKERAEADSNIT